MAYVTLLTRVMVITMSTLWHQTPKQPEIGIQFGAELYAESQKREYDNSKFSAMWLWITREFNADSSATLPNLFNQA